MGAPAARVSELSRLWAENGHDVTVLTGFPNHPTGRIADAYRRAFRRGLMRERHGAVIVERTWLAPFANRKTWERILNYASFAISAAIRGTFLARPDVVIATSPQLLVGLAGLWVSAVKRARFVFEVRDLWPESLCAVGVDTRGSWMQHALKRAAGLLYKRCHRIVTVTLAMREYLIEKWGIRPDKIAVVENGVDTGLFTPEADGSAVRNELGLDGKFVVSCIGTIGNAHNLATVVEAAKALGASERDVIFLMVGEGAEKERVRRLVESEGVRNVRIVGQQARAKVPGLIRASDVCLVLLRQSEIFKTVIPTKLLEFMSCGRAVALGVEGQAKAIVEEAECGLCIRPENSEELAAAIRRLRADPELRARLGENGRRYIVRNLSRRKTAEEYERVLSDVICERGDADPLSATLEAVREITPPQV